jgi:hypothetical protein
LASNSSALPQLAQDVFAASVIAVSGTLLTDILFERAKFWV